MENTTRDFNILLVWGMLIGVTITTTAACAWFGQVKWALAFGVVTGVLVYPLNGFIRDAALFREVEGSFKPGTAGK